MKLRSITTVLLLGLLLVVSFGGVVCEASCAPHARGMASTHACCPADMAAGGSTAQTAGSPSCMQRPVQQPTVLNAPVSLLPQIVDSALPEPATDVLSGARALTAHSAPSPPPFHLRI
jgi:hypothetical protein